MSVVPIQDATSTFDCKVPGCDQLARRNRGPTAYLCDAHARERRAAPTPPLVLPKRAPDGFEDKAKSLVEVGRKLDRAVAKFGPAKTELDAAMKSWKDACAAICGERLS